MQSNPSPACVFPVLATFLLWTPACGDDPEAASPRRTKVGTEVQDSGPPDTESPGPDSPVACAVHTEITEAFDANALEYAEAVLVGENGEVYVSLHLSAQVYVRESNGTSRRIALPDAVPGQSAVINGLAQLDGHVFAAVHSEDPQFAGLWRIEQNTLQLVTPWSTKYGVNGMAADPSRKRLFVTDSDAGVVLVIDPEEGSVDTWAAAEYLQPTFEGWGGEYGANGIAVANDAVYVSVPARRTRWSFSIGSDGTAGEGVPFLTDEGLGATDDFDFDSSGRWWLGAQFAEERAVLVDTETGSHHVLATTEDGLSLPTAIAFDPSAPNTAYVTSGAFAFDGTGSPPNLLRVSWEACGQ